MDELNVHQFYGISPFIDLLAAASAGTGGDAVGVQQQQETNAEPLCFLQVRKSMMLSDRDPHQVWMY